MRPPRESWPLDVTFHARGAVAALLWGIFTSGGEWRPWEWDKLTWILVGSFFAAWVLVAELRATR